MHARLNSINVGAAMSTLILGTLLMFAGCAKSSTTSKIESADSSYKVPEGSPKEILAFAKELQNRRPEFSSQKEGREHIFKTQQAIISASDKMLAQDLEDQYLREAVKLKMIGALSLAMIELEEEAKSDVWAKKALAAATEFRRDERRIVVNAANEFWVPAQAMNIAAMSESEREELAVEAIQGVLQKKASQESVSDGAFVAEQLTSIGSKSIAGSLYDQIADVIEQEKDPKTKSMASFMRGMAARLRLIGSRIELEGRLLSGSDLDWESYRGKVVLVDFWATWCGPCVADLPNIKASYQKYHSQGFDVIGISLDNDKKDLDGYLIDNPLPWAQLFDDRDGKAKGWGHPMARKFNISSIPSAFLVDKAGVVISTSARGPELDRLLAALFGTEG